MKNVILFINAIRPATFQALCALEQTRGLKLEPIILVEEKIADTISKVNGQQIIDSQVTRLRADFDSAESIRTALKPYFERLFAVTAQYENSITELQKIIPYLPYLNLPTELSLSWATEKKLMRQQLEAYDPNLVPAYFEVHDSSEATIRSIEQRVQYPVIIKPSGLEGSLLVSRADDPSSLRWGLEHTFREVQSGYNDWVKRQKPVVLVEEFMEGDMYSIDTYIAADGSCVHTPTVHVITGHKIGFDDFFGYMRIVPSGLSETDTAAAQATAAAACRALGLRSITAHVELMRMPNGWKVIELGPRIGGYRHDIYSLGYDINHIANDILNRAGHEVAVPDKLKSHVVVFNLYARQEGMLENIENLEVIEALPSFVSMRQLVAIGQYAKFAKNSGDPVLEVTLSHRDQHILQHDCNKLEKGLHFAIKP